MVLLSSFSFSMSSNHLLKCPFSKLIVNFTTNNKHNPFITRDAYKKRTYLYYTLSFGIFMAGVGYGTVPLYRLYCSVSGLDLCFLKFFFCTKFYDNQLITGLFSTRVDYCCQCLSNKSGVSYLEKCL